MADASIDHSMIDCDTWEDEVIEEDKDEYGTEDDLQEDDDEVNVTEPDIKRLVIVKGWRNPGGWWVRVWRVRVRVRNFEPFQNPDP